MPSQINHPGALSWHELSSTNPEEAIKFYSKVFGWTFKTLELPHGHYHIIENQGNNIGGITESLTPELPSTWTGYITVDDIDAVAITAKELGGELLYGPETIANVGRFCWIKDPTGAVIAAISYLK